MEPRSVPWPGFPQPGSTVGWTADWLVTGGALTLCCAGIMLAAAMRHDGLAVGFCAVPFASVPLLWRRRQPLLMLTVVAAAFAVCAFVGSAFPGSAFGPATVPEGTGLVFGGYAAALYGDRRLRRVAGALAAAGLAGAFTLAVAGGSGMMSGHLTVVITGYGTAWVLGDRTRTRRAYLAGLEERAARLERERDERARQAAEEERGRIARELHDLVAHNVSVIAVQAGAARRISQSDPERSVAALALIEQTARSTLSELRMLLGVLRKSDRQAPLRRPSPTLARLGELTAQARDAGIRLELRTSGDARPLDAITDLCAYRVIQEALTNIIKHAPGANAHLFLRFDAAELTVAVTDDGPGAAAGVPEGHGLIGMTERVALAGGTLRTGPALGGGFRVEARLPLADASS